MSTLSTTLRRALKKEIKEFNISMRRLSLVTDINRRCLTRFLQGFQLTSYNMDKLAEYLGYKLTKKEEGK